MRTGLLVFGGLLTLLLAGAWNPATAEGGKTIFGENKKATFKAMKGIAKSLGVKCLFCHVKEGGKPKYEVDTPRKELARRMKRSLVDSLLIKGEVQIAIEHEDHKTTVKAVYTAKGDSPGIHLTAVTGGKTFAKTIPLPEKGPDGTSAINCMTCHNGETHFLTGEEEKE